MACNATHNGLSTKKYNLVMESWKLERIREAHGGHLPFLLQPTSQEVREGIRTWLTELAGSPGSQGYSGGRRVYEKAEIIPSADAETEGFSILEALVSAGVVEASDPGEVFISFDLYRPFDDVSRINLADLSGFFDDFWYPSTDDLAIIDCRLAWICFVANWGQVRVLRAMRPR